jgi:hypothetical protein
MCQLHPSSTYHFSAEVLFDFPGRGRASVVPFGEKMEVTGRQGFTAKVGECKNGRLVSRNATNKTSLLATYCHRSSYVNRLRL